MGCLKLRSSFHPMTVRISSNRCDSTPDPPCTLDRLSVCWHRQFRDANHQIMGTSQARWSQPECWDNCREMRQAWEVLFLIDTQYLTVRVVKSAELSRKSTTKQPTVGPLLAETKRGHILRSTRFVLAITPDFDPSSCGLGREGRGYFSLHIQGRMMTCIAVTAH